MKIFNFEGPLHELELLPLAARRALDRAGVKVSLDTWKALPFSTRELLTELGAMAEVPVTSVRDSIGLVPHETIPAMAEPAAEEVPVFFEPSFGPVPTLKIWQGLSPLERYVLQKTLERARVRRDFGRYQEAYGEIVGATALSPHLDASGAARMVDVGPKAATFRRAEAESFVSLSAEVYERLEQNRVPKGNVLEVARVAGIMATKRTADLIPLCHPLGLSHAAVHFTMQPSEYRVRIVCEASITAATGVEMEALTGATVAGLTIYDMLKGLDKSIVLGPTRLVSKEGGKGGAFLAQPGPRDSGADHQGGKVR